VVLVFGGVCTGGVQSLVWEVRVLHFWLALCWCVASLLCLFICAVLGGWGPVRRAWSLHPEHLAPAGCTDFGSFSGPGGWHPLRVQLGVRLVLAACSSRWVVPFGQRGLLKVFAFQ
jgi:hypothetical protein